MKCLLKKSLSVLFAMALTFPIFVHSPAKAEEAPPDWTRYPLIAHALGGIDGVSYTNSLQAFQNSYNNGQRVFEIDFTLTEDGKLAARHDWEGYLADKLDEHIPEEQLDQPLTMKEFKSYKILEKYTPLNFTNVARLMKLHPDVYFITDTKDEDPELIKKQFTIIRNTSNAIDPTILDRIIPEIYSPAMMEEVKGIIPFKNLIFSIYLSPLQPEEIVQYVKEHHIKVVAMPFERATEEFIGDLAKTGAVTYVHSLNTVEDVKTYMDMGVHGVYTDFLTYSELGINPKQWDLAVAPQPPKSSTQLKVTKLSDQNWVAVAADSAADNHTVLKKGVWETVKDIIINAFTI